MLRGVRRKPRVDVHYRVDPETTDDFDTVLRRKGIGQEPCFFL